MRYTTMLIAVVALTFAAPAFSGKGGNGGGSGSEGGSSASKPSAYSPTLNVSLSQTRTSDSSVPYVVSGCGYDSSYGVVSVVVYTPVAVASTGANLDGSGCISVSNFDTQGAGTYRVEAWQHVKNRDVVVASTSFTV